MTLPTLIAEVLFDGVTWEDVSADVRPPIHISRGRAKDRERPGAGNASFDLNNDTGTYDRDNPSSSYAPNVRPNRDIRFRTTVDSGIGAFRMGRSALGTDALVAGASLNVYLFVGRTEGGPITIGLRYSTVSWQAVDAFKRLTLDRNSAGFGSVSLSGQRVNDTLDGATPTWPTDERDIDPGIRSLQDAAGNTNRLDYLLQVAESEGGIFFIGADGKAVFRDASYAPLPDPTVFGDVDGERRYHDLEVSDEDDLIINFVTVTATGQTDQTAKALDSQAENGRIDLGVSTLLAGGGDMTELAQSIIDGYAQPRRRVSRIVLGTSAMDWRVILTKEIGDRITVRRRTNYATTIEQVCRIEGIEHDITNASDWKLTWHLSTPPTPATTDLNLLTANQSSIETDATGWTIESGASALARVSAAAHTGLAYIGQFSLGVTIPTTTLAIITTTPYTTAPVTVGETYRATAYVASPAGATFLADIVISWVTSGGSEVSVTEHSGPGHPVLVTPIGEFKKLSIDGVAPSTSAYGVVRLKLTNQFSARDVDVDAVSFRHVS